MPRSAVYGSSGRAFKPRDGYVVVALGKGVLRQFLLLVIEMHCRSSGGNYEAGLTSAMFYAQHKFFLRLKDRSAWQLQKKIMCDNKYVISICC